MESKSLCLDLATEINFVTWLSLFPDNSNTEERKYFSDHMYFFSLLQPNKNKISSLQILSIHLPSGHRDFYYLQYFFSVVSEHIVHYSDLQFYE